jgi:uncharacterized damage-inducible protein DinB
MKENLQLQAKFNFWANKRLSHLLQNIDKSLIDKEIKSSFPTIYNTYVHIFDAETIWFKRLSGEVIQYFPSSKIEGKIAINAIEKSAENILNWCNDTNETVLSEKLSYSNTQGKSFENAKFGIVMHVLNHSSFHRGQIYTQLRNACYNESLPSLDFIAFLREMGI